MLSAFPVHVSVVVSKDKNRSQYLFHKGEYLRLGKIHGDRVSNDWQALSRAWVDNLIQGRKSSSQNVSKAKIVLTQGEAVLQVSNANDVFCFFLPYVKHLSKN